MKLLSFTNILSVLFLSYLGHLFYLIWSMVQPPACTNEGLCLKSFLLRNPSLELNIFFSSLKNPRASEVIFVKNYPLLDYNVPFKSMMTVKIPKLTKQNGTLYAHVFLSQAQKTPTSGNKWTKLLTDFETMYTLVPMSFYKEPELQNIHNLQDGKCAKKTVTHVKAVLPVSMLTEPLNLSQDHIPSDVYQYIRLYKNNEEYLPIFLHNFLQDRSYNATKVEENISYVSILLFYKPLTYENLRLLTQTELAAVSLTEMGYIMKHIDEIKAIFDTNYYVLLVLIFVAFIHILFDILAIKNDISFWRSRKSMAGLSSRLVIWRAFSQVIVLLYLIEEKVTMLIIVPTMIKAIVEVWKVFKIKPVDWKNLKFKKLNLNRAEKDTKKFDAEFMKYLSYILFPFSAISAVFLFINEPQKSWYSCVIKSLVNGTFIFGFIFMWPQIFINYRLKSVAHLPWRTFMYQAFNTFIDDFFALIIPMPTAYRFACIRDDIVFFIYVFQRWLYPVDKNRVDADIEKPEPSSEEAKTKTQ